MSDYGESSSLCWKPARATFVIPPGRSDHESCRPAGKAYGGPALTTYQRSTSAVQGYWQTASANSLHVQGAQFSAAPRKVTQEAQKDHIILGTDNYFKCSQTKWDQHIGERPPRTRGVPGYTGCQPRLEQMKGTPDHTQRTIRPCDPEGLVGAATSPMASEESPMGNACTPAHSRSEGGAALAPAYTARPVTSGASHESCYGQGGLQPMSTRAVYRPCTSGHYHASGANTWRGTCGYPLALGTSRNRGNECYGGVRNSSNGLPPYGLQTTYCRGW
ncbi:hypothetical protein WJX79_006368 [Trebouxia sp. C0005]